MQPLKDNQQKKGFWKKFISDKTSKKDSVRKFSILGENTRNIIQSQNVLETQAEVIFPGQN